MPKIANINKEGESTGASFDVKMREGGETFGATQREAMKEIKDLAPGQSVIGVVGEIEEEIPVIKPRYTREELEEKQKLIGIIKACVIPPELSQKNPNPRRDKYSFNNKLNHLELGELRRIVEAKFRKYADNPQDIPDELKVELQDKYKDLSP